MQLTYHRAGPEDLELLVRTRVETLRTANSLGPNADLSLVEAQSRA